MAKVLIVDDSKMSRMMVGKTIQKFGHEIIGEAENGELGFEEYKSLNPDIVFSDLEMPILDGHGMIKKIIEFDNEAKIVLVTSIVNAQVIQKIKNEGAFDAIVKPINDKKLQDIFDKLNL